MFRIETFKTDPISLLFCLYTSLSFWNVLTLNKRNKNYRFCSRNDSMLSKKKTQLLDFKAYFALNSRLIPKGWRKNYPKPWRVWSQMAGCYRWERLNVRWTVRWSLFVVLSDSHPYPQTQRRFRHCKKINCETHFPI